VLNSAEAAKQSKEVISKVGDFMMLAGPPQIKPLSGLAAELAKPQTVPGPADLNDASNR